MIKIYTDASTHPKHKKSVGCFIIKNEKDTIIETFQLEASDNHIAEFQTMIKALEYCLEHHLKSKLIFIYSDSNIVVTSFNKKYVKNKDFSLLLEHLLILAQDFDNLSIEWIPESQNKMADHYAKQALAKTLKKSH